MSDCPPVISHRLCALADLPIAEGRAFVVADEQIAVFRLRGGGVRAVTAICPHAGGPIADGQADDRVVVCPLHLHTFDLETGASTTGQPALRTFDARVDETGNVLVELPTA